MKVALSFFGQPRYVRNKHIFNSYKHFFLDRYDTDVFCHMWWEEDGEYDISSWVQYEGSPVTPDALSIVSDDYDPLVLKIEPPKKFNFPQPALDYIDEKFTGKCLKTKIAIGSRISCCSQKEGCTQYLKETYLEYYETTRRKCTTG